MKNNEKYGFVYIWYDRKHKRYYIGCHWGTEDDGYVCSSSWMMQAYKLRSKDFKRRILVNNIDNRNAVFLSEKLWLDMIPIHKLGKRYYNLSTNSAHWSQSEGNFLSIGEKISKAKIGKSNGPRSQEVKDAISLKNKGKVRTPEMNAAMGLRRLGTKDSEETKRKKSEALKLVYAEGRRMRGYPAGKYKRSEETCKNISNALTGKRLSEEHCEAIRLAAAKSKENKKQCPHCNFIGWGPTFSRYHGDNCRVLTNFDLYINRSPKNL
jgi:hypothetical protein